MNTKFISDRHPKFKIKNVLLMIIVLILAVFLLYKKDVTIIELLAFLAIFLTTILLFKFKENLYILFVCLPIFYATYSIAVGEFIAKNLQVSINSIRAMNYGLYEKSLVIIIIFLLTLIIFIKDSKQERPEFIFEDNIIIYAGLYLLIILINIFFFDRSVNEGYVVRGTPIQGYTYVLFVFLNYYSGNKPVRRNLSVILAILVSVQVMIFGGRGSVIPIAVITIITYFSKLLDFKRFLLLTSIGVVAFTFVGTYRSAESVSIANILINLRENLFVQDTSIMAFNASVTHVAASEVYDLGFRLKSFVAFIIAIILGGNTEITNLSNVTPISSKINLNLGGGLMPTYFYFWLGWSGVVLSGFFLAKILNKGIHAKNRLAFLSFVTMIAGTTTWYLYSPLQLFRVTLVVVPILYFTLSVLNAILKKKVKFKR